MAPLAIGLGICLLVYILIYNIVLMAISSAISDHLRKQGIPLKADPNLAGMTNSDFWNEVESSDQNEPDPVLTKFLRAKKVLIMLGVAIGIAFVASLVVR